MLASMITDVAKMEITCVLGLIQVSVPLIRVRKWWLVVHSHRHCYREVLTSRPRIQKGPSDAMK